MAWTDTRNLPTSRGDRAAAVMAATAAAAPELKRLAGVVARGRKLEKPVCHYSRQRRRAWRRWGCGQSAVVGCEPRQLCRGGRKPGAKNKPKPLLARVQAAAERKSMAAVARLASIMADPEVPPAVAVQAARVLLAYGVGRPPPMDDPGTGRAEAFRVTARILGIEEPEPGE